MRFTRGRFIISYGSLRWPVYRTGLQANNIPSKNVLVITACCFIFMKSGDSPEVYKKEVSPKIHNKPQSNPMCSSQNKFPKWTQKGFNIFNSEPLKIILFQILKTSRMPQGEFREHYDKCILSKNFSLSSTSLILLLTLYIFLFSFLYSVTLEENIHMPVF